VLAMNSTNPINSEMPKEVHLPQAPLAVVLAQIRFPPIFMIEKGEFIASFQEAIRDDYPLSNESRRGGILLGPGGLSLPAQEAKSWQFSDSSAQWRVTLAANFVSLETRHYTSRSDFLERLRVVAVAVEVTIKPKMIDRLGIRYIDQVRGQPFRDLKKIIREPILGVLASEFAGTIEHSLTETSFSVEAAKIVARWGLLPPNATIDPGILEAIDEPSWLLDLDMYREEHAPFEIASMIDSFDVFAQRLYTIFRWAVTPEFLRIYGGQP